MNVHYGDVLIKYGSFLDAKSDEIPYIVVGKESKKQCYLNDGDVIIADTAEDDTVGKSTEIINSQEAKIEAGLHTIPCHPRIAYAPMFLGYYMNSPHYHKQLIPLMQGIKVLSVSKNNIGNTLISAPTSYSEQKKIVNILHLLDYRINKQQQLIEILKKYKRGLHNKVFTKSAKSNWSKTKLQEIASFCGGGTPSKDVPSYWSGDIGWISSSDLQEDWIDTISVTRRINEDAIKNSATKICPKGSIAIVSRVGVGKVAIMPEDLCTSQDFTNITEIAGNPQFMAYQIAYKMKIEADKTQGTSIKGITTETIKSLLIEIPAIKEQEHIARMLSDFDNHLRHEIQKLETLLRAEKSFLQQLFI